MERLLFVSGRFVQNDDSTSVGDFDCTIPFKPIVTVEDINELKETLKRSLNVGQKETLKRSLKVERVSITNFRRLESPE